MEKRQEFDELKTQFRETLHQKNLEIEELKKAFVELKKRFNDLAAQHEILISRSQKERDAFVTKLQEDGAHIESLERLVNTLIEKQEALEKELLDSLGIVLIENLGESSNRLTPPNGQHEAYEVLFYQLIGSKKPNLPIYSIKNQAGVFKVGTEKTKNLDSFTASVLIYILLKGYDQLHLNRLDREGFKAVIEAVDEIFRQFPSSQNELEYKSLQMVLVQLRGFTFDNPLELDAVQSVESFVNAILTSSSLQTIRQPFVRSSIVIEALVNKFGEKIVNDVMGYYSLYTPDLWNEKDIAILTLGIVANLDVEAAKYHFKTDKETILLKGLNDLRKSAFLFAQKYTLKPTIKQEKQLQKDLNLLHALLKVGTVDLTASGAFPNAARLACIENLGRELVYSLTDPAFSYFNLEGGGVTQFKENLLVSVAGLTGEPRLYQLKTLVRAGGVYGYTLLPTHPQKGDENIVLFRGTFDLASVCRDLGFWERNTLELWPEGPGARSFAQREKEIVDNWARARAETDTENMLIIGHSLGGSDAARFIAALFQRGLPLDEFKNMTLVTFNAPHVETNVHRTFSNGVQKNKQCQFSVTHFEGEGDIVPAFGIKRIAGNVMAANLSTETITFTQTEAKKKGYYSSHTTPWFTIGGDATLTAEALLKAHGIALQTA